MAAPRATTSTTRRRSLSRSGLALGVMIACAAVLGGLRSGPVQSRERGTGENVRLSLRAGVPLDITDLFLELHRKAGIEAVAARPRVVGGKLKVRKADLTAGELLDLLEEELEGRWQRRGRLYVLGPPEGFEEIARLSPVRYSEYSARLWERLKRELRREDWKNLRERKRVEVTELRVALRPTVLELARLAYWIRREEPEEDESLRVTPAMLREGHACLRIEPCPAHRNQVRLAVMAWARSSEWEVRGTWHHLNHTPWVIDYWTQPPPPKVTP